MNKNDMPPYVVSGAHKIPLRYPLTSEQAAHIAEVKNSPLGHYLKEYESELKEFTFYHYTTWSNFLKICESKKFKLSRLGESNDPFEFFPPFKYGSERKEWEKIRTKRIFASASLSTRMSSPPMWAHYAQNHTGVCLAFNLPLPRCRKGTTKSAFGLEEDVLTYMIDNHIFTKIVYADNRPAVDYDTKRPKEKRYWKAVCEAMIYKSTDWSYENEFKLLVGGEELPECDRPSLLFSGLLPHLHGVILGMNCAHGRSEVRKLLNPIGIGYVKVVKAKRHNFNTHVLADGFKDTCEQSLSEWAWDADDFYESASERGLITIPEHLKRKKTNLMSQKK